MDLGDEVAVAGCLRAISNCNQTLLRATEEPSLLDEICRIVCEEAGYRVAWVGYAEHDQAKSVRPAAWTGTEEGYLAISALLGPTRSVDAAPPGRGEDCGYKNPNHAPF